MANSIADLINKGKEQKEAPKKPTLIPYEDAIKTMPKQLRETFDATSRKALTSPDVAQLRLVSWSDRQSLLRNEQTIFLNMLEANATQRVTDYQIRIRERKIGSDQAFFFNMDGSLPAGAQSNRPFRYNTLGAFGNLLDIKFMPQELSAQSPIDGTDLLAQEVDDEVVRLRRFANAKLLKNTEQNNESSVSAAVNIPQWGGFIDRSTLYNVSTSGDLTNPLIQGRVDAIANISDPQGVGYSVPLVCLVDSSQISKVRDLMIARYPGENSEAYFATLKMLTQRLADVDIPMDQMSVYKPDPGRPIVFINEGQLPSGTALFFDPTRPQLARFQMMGQYGPWVLERPTQNLTTLLLVWDAISLVDPLIETRSIITGLN